eukprot:XP_011669948.1 PREDICTED: cytochrome P450 2U1-like [Strongylocentrotus purpuratus]
MSLLDCLSGISDRVADDTEPSTRARRPTASGVSPYLKLPPFKGFAHLATRYGGLISLRLGTKLTVVLNDVDSVKQSLVKEADVFTDRNVPIEYSLALPLEGSLAFASGDKWRELRTFVAKAFRQFEVEKEKLESVIVRESERLCKAFQDEANKSSSDIQGFDPHHIINNAVSNIICSMCFGQSYEYSDPEFHHILTVVGNSFRSLSPSGLLLVSRYFYYTPLYREVRRNLAVLQDFIRGIVQRHQETFDPDNTRDIIDMYLEENIWRGVFDIFLAASESMTSALRWIFLYLIDNPELQSRRLCVGDRIARMQMFLFLTTLIRKFEYSLPDGAVPDFNVDGGNFTLSAVPFKIVVTEVETPMPTH